MSPSPSWKKCRPVKDLVDQIKRRYAELGNEQWTDKSLSEIVQQTTAELLRSDAIAYSVLSQLTESNIAWTVEAKPDGTYSCSSLTEYASDVLHDLIDHILSEDPEIRDVEQGRLNPDGGHQVAA